MDVGCLLDRSEFEAEVILRPEIPEEEIEDLRTLLIDAGVAFQLRRAAEHRSGVEWLVLVALPLQAFLSGLGAEMVKDFYRYLRGLAVRLRKRGSNGKPDFPLVLTDSRHEGLHILLSDDLPLEAYDKLQSLNLRGLHGSMKYDHTSGEWHCLPGKR